MNIVSDQRPRTGAQPSRLHRCPSKRGRLRSSQLPKLLQKAHIVLKQQSNIVELINPRTRSIDAQPKRETGELFGIDVRRPKYIRMHHARPAQLDPSRPFANATAVAAAVKATVVDFGAGLGERKI